MNFVTREKASLCAAIALGLGVSTGSSLGMAAAAGMPIVCLMPATRRAAFESTLGYYVVALWPMVLGLERYLGGNALLVTIAIWIIATILLSLPWTVAWTSDRAHFVWRAPLALAMTVVPPLGIIGLASPLAGAGYLFPGSSWVGLGMTACVPGIILSTAALSFRRRCLVVCFVIGFAGGIAVEGQLFPPPPVDAPIGWTAVNTTFGDISQPFRDFAASEFIQQKSADLTARVLIFPEAVVPRWSDATKLFWQTSLDRARARGQILALGVGLPAAQAQTPQDYREELRELGALDFAAALDALKSADKPHANYGIATASDSIKPHIDPTDNAMVIVGAESATFYQRVPVPVGMWRPFSRISVPVRLAGPGVIEIDRQRAAVLICYEQMITWPILASMPQHPTVIVGISNTFWVDHTSIPRYQSTALRGWAKLFRLPYFSAVNS
jgi:hypothetical protein